MITMPAVATLRPALATEAPALTALAMRSKAHWGYDATFMAAAVADLTISPELVARATCYVAERDDQIIGVYVLSIEEGLPTLRDLWVEPAVIGTGVGAMLFRHMLAQARSLGHAVVRIESDPNAEPFYSRMGARHVGVVESKIVPGRTLPLMEVDVQRDAAPSRRSQA
jgi:predicted N-acetyltransferase YhbS